mmetsp:Transcript_16940/g.24851  ORF Transcript_16940/g.24851 Transcript_16940/m.24851 type:complete len:83 (-) Transcript_16940:920-1168(-)
MQWQRVTFLFRDKAKTIQHLEKSFQNLVDSLFNSAWALTCKTQDTTCFDSRPFSLSLKALFSLHRIYHLPTHQLDLEILYEL